MVAEAPDKVEGNAYELHLKTTAAQSHALNFSGNEYVPKARKPYIITKQREKWTDDEHQKFLEALKLHGRAWRQIEEYVGTKTTIQIRSHAQKYFNKVGRENLGSSEGSLDVFVIPPPRPKKKPLHPYPRKVVNPIKRVEMKATSPPRDVIGVERSRLSPTSCTTDDVLLMENDNECLTSNNNTSVEEEKRSLESVQATNNKLFTKAEMLTLGGPYSLDNPPETEECSTTIRLFGRTLKVNDSQKLSSLSTAEDTEIHLKDAAAAEEEELKVENSPIIPDKEPKYAFGFIQGNFTALSCFVPPQYGMNKECSDAGLVSGGIPWWGVCQGMVFPQVSSMAAADSVVESPSCDKRDQETEPRKEGSINNSNSGSEANELKTKSNDIESKARSKTLKKRSSAKKGFVPYKRCLTERDAPSPIVSAEERKKQKARVCS